MSACEVLRLSPAGFSLVNTHPCSVLDHGSATLCELCVASVSTVYPVYVVQTEATKRDLKVTC